MKTLEIDQKEMEANEAFETIALAKYPELKNYTFTNFDGYITGNKDGDVTGFTEFKIGITLHETPQFPSGINQEYLSKSEESQVMALVAKEELFRKDVFLKKINIHATENTYLEYEYNNGTTERYLITSYLMHY